MEDKAHIPLPSPALTLLSLLEGAGFEAWCVGGFVRDALIGRKAGDIDIASSAPWDKAQALFEAQGLKTFETGVKHGTLTVLVGSDALEVTTFRTDGTYTDGRRPDSVTFVESIEEDLARRDFTMNAIAYHPERGLFDPQGGQRDIEARVIRAVGEARTRFAEDALRILRGVRFASQLGFSLEEATRKAMVEQRGLLEIVAAERVSHELGALICGAFVRDTLLAHTDIIGQVLPELLPMKGFDQKTPYHVFDVLEHTACCMENTRPCALVRWAALFHDSGKPAAFFTDDAGVGHFYGHAKISVTIAQTAMRRLRLPRALVSDVLLLVEHHDDILAATPKSVKRMLRKLGGRPEMFFALTELKRGDAAAQAPHCRHRVGLAHELDAVLEAVLEAGEVFSLHDLAIDGKDLKALGIPPGPLYKELLEGALESVLSGQVPNEKPSLIASIQGRLEP
ncbi:MAG: HD domain-containing protein [Eggerthellaceae bacterium]|jgi:tRNA nucleotidyltransferase (CCA-adding enzyme)|nr:HD domain-containing protein [Eggerthellaceae bacterium]MDR2715576.1 HD domain-containing protein [Coriobacteriaceae bacterium]